MAQQQYPAWLDEYAQQCPHKHFKSKVVDRDFLTRKQHLDLLCTPRGYRWEVAYQVSSDKNQDKFKDPCDQSKSRLVHPKAHVYNILAELWSVVTPEMIERLKTMLMEEFGIPEDQAVDFMCKKVQETMCFASPRAREKDKNELDSQDDKGQKASHQPRLIQLDLEKSQRSCEPLPAVKPTHVKMFSNAVSKKLAEVLTTSLRSKRSKNHKLLSNFILESLCKITGDHCTMDGASTILQKAQAFFADKFALWILQNVKDEDAQRGRKRALEDSAIKKKTDAKLKEKMQREIERIKLAKKLEQQNKMIEKVRSEQKSGEEDKKKKKQQEREERYAQWQKRDEENRKEEDRKRKERTAKNKQEQQEKAKKEAERKEQITKDNAARKKRKEEMLARQRMEERRQEQVKKKDSTTKTKQKNPGRKE